jgi:hypothetical protein
MTTTSDAKIEALASAIGNVANLSETERQSILEIAYCTVAADHEIHERERLALRLICEKLGGTQLDANKLMARLEAAADKEVAEARLRKIATQLQTATSREVAYKAANALARADDEDSDGEFEFDLALIDALGLSQSDADRLAGEVEAALGSR